MGGTQQDRSGDGKPGQTPSRALPRRLAQIFGGIGLLRSEQNADHETEQRHTLNQGGCNNHGCTNVASSFRLTRRTLHGRASKAADAVSGANGHESGAESCSEKSQCSWFHNSFSVLSRSRFQIRECIPEEPGFEQEKSCVGRVLQCGVQRIIQMVYKNAARTEEHVARAHGRIRRLHSDADGGAAYVATGSRSAPAVTRAFSDAAPLPVIAGVRSPVSCASISGVGPSS